MATTLLYRALLLTLGIVGWVPLAGAQTIDNPAWAAMRVFVDENDVESVVTEDYIPIQLTELESLLAENAQRRIQQPANITGIQRAVYVARFSDQQLASRASLWQVAMPAAGGALTIDKLSLAIEEPQGFTENVNSLTRQLRYVDQPQLELVGAEGLQTYWFGFKAKTRRRDMGQQSVELALPKAVLATMLIAVPAQISVTSNLPCMPVTDIKPLLPDEWPVQNFPALQADERWFAVWLSGRESCSLNFVPVQRAGPTPYRLALASSQSDTLISASGMQVNSRFQLTQIPPDGKVQLLVDAPLHIRSVFINNVEVKNWKSLPPVAEMIPTAVADVAGQRVAHAIEIPIEVVADTNTVIAVESIGRLSFPFEGPLPRVEVADGYVLDGRCTLSGRDAIVIDDAQCKAHVLSNSSQSGSISWQWQWTGKSPIMQARLRPQPSQWNIDALTRLSLQNDLVVATVHANVSSRSAFGNQVRLRLASGWFVDSVEMENAPLGASITPSDAADNATELNIRWEERRNDLDARIILKAHYPQRTDVDNLQLPTTRILSLAGAQQTDTCVIESSGQFRLEVDPELLRLKAREDDLVAWQREQLPRLGEAWIFRSGRSSLPLIRLTRTKATMETQLQTSVTHSTSEAVAHYRILCRPISGSIKQVRISLPLPANLPAPTWALVPSVAGALPSGLSASSTAVSSSTGETTFTVELSKELAEPFHLEAEVRLSEFSARSTDTTQQLRLPLPLVPQAVSQDAVLVLPAGTQLPDNLSMLEVLPAGMCCSDRTLALEGSGIVSDTLAVRYDAGMLNRIDVSLPSTAQSKGWIREVLHEHWQHSADRVSHRSTWLLANPHAHNLTIRLPVDWELHQLLVDGLRIDSTESSHSLNESTTSVMVVVPAGKRVQVELKATSRNLRGWAEPAQYHQPQLDWPVERSRHLVWFPPSVWAGQEWQFASSSTWRQRFWPQQWWHLLSMAVVSQRQPPADDEAALNTHEQTSLASAGDSDPLIVSGNWWPLELRDDETVADVWSVDRTWIASLLLCACLLFSMMILIVCGNHIGRWCAGYILLGAALCLVPDHVVWLVQLCALAWVAASLLALTRGLIVKARQPVRRSDSVQISTGALARIGVVMWALTSGQLAPPIYAQAPRAQTPREIFGIVIPLDAEKKVAGEYVYISPRLESILRTPGSRENQARPVAVASVFYSLTLSNNPVGLINELGDLTVELTVQANEADAELRLPFAKNELMLQRAFLDSQIMTVGERIRQESDAIVWRAQGTDRHTLRMSLRPRGISQRDGRGYFSVAIPAIPTARLDLLGDDLRDVNIDATGGIQMDSPRAMTARLGPLNRLSINWPLSSTRSPPQVQSDTWIHSRGDKIMAQCQLRLRGAAALSKQLSVVGDGNWIPIGYDWNDVRLLTTEPSTAGRVAYTVERKDESASELTLRVLMLPKDGSVTSTLSVPFLTLPQAGTTASRTLALSHTDSPQWRVTGTEGWQAQLASQAAQIWDKSRLAEQPTIWRVPAGTKDVSLQRLAAPAVPLVEETTEVVMHLPETRLKYVAKWETPVVGVAAVRFQLPIGWHVDGVYVDSLPARHSLSPIAVDANLPASNAQAASGPASNGHELVVFVDSSLGGIHALSFQLSMPTRLQQPFRLPRPLLKEYQISSSIVQLFRGAELTSQARPLDESGLELKKVELRSSQLLQELHTCMGQLELGDEFRQTAELPFEVSLSHNQQAPASRAIMRLNRSDQGWRAQLDAIVDVQPDQANPVFFDMPRALGEPLEANVTFLLWPSADSNRVILCAMPAQSAQGPAHISFAVRLPSTGTSQGVTIPDIRMLGLANQRPIVALPTVVAGESVRWTQVGRALPASWLDQPGMQQIELKAVNVDAQVPAPTDKSQTWYSLHETAGGQTQAVWQAQNDQQQAAKVLLTNVVFEETFNQPSAGARPARPASINGEITWWIDPRGRTYLNIACPQELKLVGLEANDQPTTWDKSADGSLRVLMQPSYLPLRLKAYVVWPQGAERDLQSLVQLPLLVADAQTDGPVLLAVRKSVDRSVDDGQSGSWQAADGTLVSSQEVDRLLGQAWASVLTESAPTAADRGKDELASWLPGWQPQSLGLNPSTMISVKNQVATAGDANSGANAGEMQLTVLDFWQRFPAQSEQPGQASPDLSTVGFSHADYVWYQFSSGKPPTELQFNLSSGQMAAENYLHWLVATGWVLTCVLVVRSVTGRSGRLLNYLKEVSWPLWLLLAVSTSVFLPTVLPGIILGLAAGIVLLKRYKQLGQSGNQWVLPKVLR